MTALALPHIRLPRPLHLGLWVSWISLCLLSLTALGIDVVEEPTEAPLERRHEVVQIGQDALVKANESVGVVVVLNGNAQIDGEVREAIVVVGGNVKVTGKVRGNTVVAFGDIEAGPTASIRRPAVVVGGAVHSDPKAKVRSDNVVVTLTTFPLLGAGAQWITQGALYLRPLPPRVLWVWSIALAFFLVYALMSLILAQPAKACVEALVDRPILSYVLGVAGSMLIFLALPIVVVLGAVGVGFILAIALVIGCLFGRMVVMRFIGYQLGTQLGIPALQKPLVALAAGTAVLSLFYMMPVVGFLVWFAVIPMAVGAILMAVIQVFRAPREAVTTGNPPPLNPSVSGPPPLPLGARPTERPAGFFVRSVATFIDLVLVACVAQLFHPHGRVFLMIWMAYHVLFWGWRGYTLGNRVMGIMVVEADGRIPSLSVAFVRSLAAFLSAIPLFLGFVWAAWDLKKQSWHDKLAGTVMVWRR